MVVQAEDGIRDLVRSRGLGDVYKRQIHGTGNVALERDVRGFHERVWFGRRSQQGLSVGAVSYTHLTLPTSDLV